MAELSENTKSQSVKFPWWGWVLVGIAVVLALPSLFSDDPLGVRADLTATWQALQSIGEDLWFFASELFRIGER